MIHTVKRPTHIRIRVETSPRIISDVESYSPGTHVPVDYIPRFWKCWLRNSASHRLWNEIPQGIHVDPGTPEEKQAGMLDE
jgi:hypothetical protein